LADLETVAGSDERMSSLYSDLNEVCARLSNAAQAHFPGSPRPPSSHKTIGGLREIGKSSNRFTYCSPAMHIVIDKIERAAKRDVPILISGETGVGKELVARFIHFSSARHRGPMIPVNCAAIPRELFENHFFGHKQGAFTGALQNYPGVIRSASGGTL